MNRAPSASRRDGRPSLLSASLPPNAYRRPSWNASDWEDLSQSIQDFDACYDDDDDDDGSEYSSSLMDSLNHLFGDDPTTTTSAGPSSGDRRRESVKSASSDSTSGSSSTSPTFAPCRPSKASSGPRRRASMEPRRGSLLELILREDAPTISGCVKPKMRRRGTLEMQEKIIMKDDEGQLLFRAANGRLDFDS